ncbi:LacI family DNA-binding transcriptional regulator [Agrococcus sp. ARC_14]|uniref:LacI family DNA-binding transcriptional regulator n=1 Tax=Agrococcus sp. ARC_14 TaxID=2919927 RepID=UPI001F059927|nr:LacI family DNA-binding transcriptional regulator [Agrococcus sp. ARC_14]MCH1883827.1 LacI family transcriptional regulator [Agrococcus sp. ARC_14]
MASLQDVADAAGVSRSVASRVLSGDARARISETTRERVREAATRLRYAPDHQARGLRTRRAGAVALLVPDVNNAIFAELLAGVEATADEHGSVVIVGSVGDERDVASIVGRGRVDGAILQRPESMTDNELRASLQLEVPTVLFNSRIDGYTGSVILDDAVGVAIAARHLVERGHRDIGFVGGRPLHDAAGRRRDAFLAAMANHGLVCLDGWVQEGGWEAEDGAAAMRRLLDHDRRPSAVVVASANAAFGAASAAHDRGIDIPSDLSLVTLQDPWLARFAVPALTVVRMPMREAGAASTEMIYDHLLGQPLTDVVIDTPAPILVERGSVRGRPQGS